MWIQVERFFSDSDATLSKITVDGAFVCFGLEDEYREHKVHSETRISAGIYQVGLRTEGGFHARYARRFPHVHRGMLQIQDVPGFEYILIHVGNTDEDTAGCLLVGLGCNAETGDLRLVSSVRAYLTLYPLVIDEAQAGRLAIEIVDRDAGLVRAT